MKQTVKPVREKIMINTSKLLTVVIFFPFALLGFVCHLIGSAFLTGFIISKDFWDSNL